MIRINQLKTKAGAPKEAVIKKALKLCGIPEKKIKNVKVLKKSTDARKKNGILDVYSLLLETSLSGEEESKTVKRAGSKDVSVYEPVKYSFNADKSRIGDKRPVIAGFGPAGIFLAYVLALNGFKPLIIERGKSVDKRKEDLERFFETGILDPSSNAQFGEGGAGAFSDGKLNTLIKDEKGRGRFILETFVKFGADEEILYDAKPHIGTDKLIRIIPRIRKRIEKYGGEVRFESCLTGIEVSDGRLEAVTVNGSERIGTDTLFLCIGHSARDTYFYLYEQGIKMEPKAFAVGLRTEHTRELIDKALNREKADYKLTHKCEDGRGVYSFCMCPGGYVINSSSEEGELCVNGMSYSGRNGKNSNSAIVVTVGEKDYNGSAGEPLNGIGFQRELERKAYELAGGKVPYQRYGDYKKNRASDGYGDVEPSCKGQYEFTNLRGLLPDDAERDIIEGMEHFGRKIQGFSDDDVLFAGVESRTSSPVRIVRDGTFQSNIRGIYPVGEGAGYAGGIMSAAADGLKAAESYAKAVGNDDKE
ncbi:MAG: FAD-dependent oxidoreductase [Lachnospiraceae bacterium]|nr:FAD-dependent oxidoreductase [Lachnospiraceae bacterium]